MQPILYSFRRCPYAMRARLAILSAGLSVELREIALKNKPEAMLAISPKGTVPVLQLPDGQVIDESLLIMRWALAQSDPEGWLNPATLDATLALIADNDGDFKYYLDRYKYADRYPQQTAEYYRQQAEKFLATLELCLNQHHYLSADSFSLADAAILPFIRQFAAVDQIWFNSAPYPSVRFWLQQWLASVSFHRVMTRYSIWQLNDRPLLFGQDTCPTFI